MLERTNLTAPSTSFNGRVSPHRRFAFGQLTLEAVKQVKNEHGCTVNDVVLSICAGALRWWLLEHDELPDGPLVAQVPVSVRSEAQMGTYGNRIGMLSVPLYVDEADPVQRLLRTHEAMKVAKTHHQALPAQLLQDATQFIPPAVFCRASRITFSLAATGRPIWNLVVSNVPGPQFPLYMAGAQLVANYPVSVITDGMGLNITVMSYCGHLDFGIVADREQMRDVWKLIGWLEDSLAELLPPGTEVKPPGAPPAPSRDARRNGASAAAGGRARGLSATRPGCRRSAGSRPRSRPRRGTRSRSCRCRAPGPAGGPSSRRRRAGRRAGGRRRAARGAPRGRPGESEPPAAGALRALAGGQHCHDK